MGLILLVGYWGCQLHIVTCVCGRVRLLMDEKRGGGGKWYSAVKNNTDEVDNTLWYVEYMWYVEYVC